jgi:hypothetical protein
MGLGDGRLQEVRGQTIRVELEEELEELFLMHLCSEIHILR